MMLAQVAQVAQVVSSVALVASLIFVGIQIRRNTRATRAASHHAITEALNRINLLWARDKDVARIWLVGIEDRRALTPEERWRFDSVLRAYLHVCETMYTQAALGAGDAGIVAAEEAGLRRIFKAAGVQASWAENTMGFSREFRGYIATLADCRMTEAARAKT